VQHGRIDNRGTVAVVRDRRDDTAGRDRPYVFAATVGGPTAASTGDGLPAIARAGKGAPTTTNHGYRTKTRARTNDNADEDERRDPDGRLFGSVTRARRVFTPVPRRSTV